VVFHKKKYDFLKHELLQSYGFEKMFTLNNLESLGMFRPQPKRNNWPTVKKALRLLEEKDKVELKNPSDITYAYQGYAPLSVRLIEYAAKGGWKRIEEILNTLPGKMYEYNQELPSSIQERSRYFQDTKISSSSTPPTTVTKDGERKKPLTLVFFLGGVTFAEISALRFLSERENHGRDYIIATTKLINGNTLVDSITEHVVNKLDKKTLKSIAS